MVGEMDILGQVCLLDHHKLILVQSRMTFQV